MRLKNAIRRRILQLCYEHNLTPTALAKKCGISHTTLFNIINKRNNSTSIATIKRICDGLEIELPVFFDSDLFRNLEQEIF